MTTATLRPPEAAGIGRGLALALLAHGLLILALSYGLNWHSDSSPAFEAELWSSVPQVAAPREEAPPEPEPKPEPPKPDLKAQQQAEEEAAEQREAEIAVAKAKKLKEEKARDEAAKLQREKAEKDKAAKEEQDRKKAQDAKAAKEAKEADARREAQRQEFLRRIQGMAGGTPGSTGSASQNSGPSADWIGRVRSAISRSVNFPGKSDSSNPEVAIRVFLAPDGQILGRKVTRPSPEPGWDTAVERGIDALGRVPVDGSSRMPAYLDITLRPHEDGFVPR